MDQLELKTIDDLRALSERVDDLYATGKTDEARALLQGMAAAQEISSAYVLFFESELMFQEKNFEQELELLEQAIAERGDDYFLLRSKGVCLSNLGRREEAIVLYDKALAIKPDDYRSLRSKGVSLSELGRDEEARAVYDKALAINPDDSQSLREKGASFFRLGREEEAIAVYDKALAIKPDDYHSLRNKGVSLSKLGREEEARAVYDKALAINPDDYHSLREKGVILSKLGREEEARAVFDKALAIKPDDYHSLRNKGVCLSNLGREEEAIALYDKALEIKPDDPFSLLNKGINQFKLGQHQEALALLEQANALKPDDPDIASAYGYAVQFIKIIQGLIKLAAPAGNKKIPKQEAAPQTDAVASGVDDLRVLVVETRRSFEKDIESFKRNMLETEEKLREYIEAGPRLDDQRSLFFLLRKWNSYTPIVSGVDGEDSVGGGYFLYHRGVGVIVDPGCDFINNFHRAGLRIADVQHIIVTHAHNDHTADFESLLTLFHQCNRGKEKDKQRQISIYFSPSALMKLNSLIGLKSPSYIKDVHPVSPGQTYDLGKGLSLRILPAYHQDTVAKDYAIGVRFDIGSGPEARRIVMTSDTSLFPTAQGMKSVNTKAPEIWTRYGLGDSSDSMKPVDLLIPHIGSVRPAEFDANIDSRYDEIFYPNHLGVMGTLRVITALRPGLAVVSEFGEELKNFRPKLMRLLAQVVAKQCEQTRANPINVLFGDLPFVYDVAARGVYCVVNEEFIPAADIACCLVRPDHCDETFTYFINSNSKEDDEIQIRSSTEKFMKQRSGFTAEFFKKK
ncbi:MAG: tetratricopeptide repeat protein [Desulfovibrio sp.]